MRSAPGGRLQTSFHVRSDASTFLIDCGTTTLIGMRRLGLDPNDIDTVFVTHLHGDHFGGLPWLLIDAQYVSKRTRPLVVTGPRASRRAFSPPPRRSIPTSPRARGCFELNFVEYEEQKPLEVRRRRPSPPSR